MSDMISLALKPHILALWFQSCAVSVQLLQNWYRHSASIAKSPTLLMPWFVQCGLARPTITPVMADNPDVARQKPVRFAVHHSADHCQRCGVGRQSIAGLLLYKETSKNLRGRHPEFPPGGLRYPPCCWRRRSRRSGFSFRRFLPPPRSPPARGPPVGRRGRLRRIGSGRGRVRGGIGAAALFCGGTAGG